MQSIFTVPVLILGELVVVLLVCLFFLFLYVRKQKFLLDKLLKKCSQIREVYSERERELKGLYAQLKSTPSTSDIPEFLSQSIDDALKRYEKFAQAKIPKIDPTQGFNAKVAALRYFYLTAEKDAYEKAANPATTWSTFEKKLAEIVRWFAKHTTHRQDVRSNRTRLLQEKIDALKPFEAENKKLQRSLDHAKKRQEQLETYLRENKATIAQLQKLLHSLQHLNPDADKTKKIPVTEMATADYLSHTSGQVDSIADASQEQGHVIKNIIYELNNTHHDLHPEVKKKMETSLRIMEIEMIKSDQYIASLKDQLKDARLQVTNYALMLRETKTEKGSDVDALVVSGPAAEFEIAGPAPLAPSDYLNPEKVMAEIRHLRENNRTQRGVIVALEREISVLKESIMTTGDEQLRQVKQQEVQRLERMVKECEHCIETLESEVDNLYLQLKERTSGTADADEFDTEEDANDTARLSRELEDMAKEMEKIMFQYRQTHAVNQFMYDIINMSTVEDVAKGVIQFLNEFSVPAGFSIRSSVGDAEYFPGGLFNENMKELTKSFSFHEPIFYVNDGTLFSSEKFCLMALPAENSAKPLHESTLSGLVRIVNNHLQHLKSLNNIAQRSEAMNSWIELTKNHLADLDIQYAYQVEENRKTFNNFIAEIRQAYHLLDLKGSGLILLDNAINEYEQRMYLLLSSGDIIDREISTLINHIDSL